MSTPNKIWIPNNTIPEMTDPMGKYWEQPALEEIEVWTNHARMTEKTLARLMEYSTSMPTGAYPGKMWRKKVHFRTGPRWYLCWYGYDLDPKYVSNNFRKIVIVDQEK
jgi:hypothetical protein